MKKTIVKFTDLGMSQDKKHYVSLFMLNTGEEIKIKTPVKFDNGKTMWPEIRLIHDRSTLHRHGVRRKEFDQFLKELRWS